MYETAGHSRQILVTWAILSDGSKVLFSQGNKESTTNGDRSVAYTLEVEDVPRLTTG